MLTLKFDPEKRDITGSFAARAALVDACEKMDPADPAYHAWAVKHGVNPNSGSIVTTAYNPDLLDRRAAALQSRLNEFKGGPPSGLSYQIPAGLIGAFDDAAMEGAPDPFKVLMISTTREVLHFDLQEKFPELNLQTVIAAPDKEYADRCNALIAATAPELSDKVVYKSDWHGQGYDLVAVNPAVHYFDEKGLQDLAGEIAGTNAKLVVFSNLIRNNNADGDPEWKAQRYSGGIIPLRIPARGELARVMQQAGYNLDSFDVEPPTFDQNKGSNFAAQNPTLDNYSFSRN